MDPMASFDSGAIRWMQYIYFAGGIGVIILGAVGTVFIILGILQTRFLKPYRNRYPYDKYKSFEEFAFKKPAHGENAHFHESYPPAGKGHSGDEKKEPTILTWENAKDFIPNLTEEDTINIEKMAEAQYEGSSGTSDQ